MLFRSVKVLTGGNVFLSTDVNLNVFGIVGNCVCLQCNY